MADNLTANENMMGHLECIRGKDIFRGYDWNGTDHTGGTGPDDPRHVWGGSDTPWREVIAHATAIGATAIIHPSEDSGYYFRNNPKETIIQRITDNLDSYNKLGCFIFFLW